jgi:membrane fusion protein (multidrug efflux system)
VSQIAQIIESRVLKANWRKYGTSLIVISLAVAVIVTITRNWNGWEGGRTDQATNDAYVRGDLTPLSTKVPGIVREVRVNDYQAVHKGDVLVQLDDDDYRAQVAQAVAGVEAARAAHTLLRSNESAAEAERRGKAVLKSQESQLIADLHAKEAALTVAQVNLGYTRILAPGDGTVGERQVRPGQLVSPGTQVMTFVETTRWVAANFRETQLTNIKPGDVAEVRVDVYPGQVIRGRVLEIAPASGSQFALLPPDNATGNFTKVVQRVPVKIALDDSPLTAQLRPGLSAVVSVRTKR